jgi:hypothetical protein
VGRTEDELAPAVSRLSKRVAELPPPAAGRVPYVLVIPPPPAAWRVAAERVAWGKGTAFTDMAADDLAAFAPVAGVDQPAEPYLLVDVDTGPDLLNVRPQDAMGKITGAGRSPLTVPEGIGLMLQHPELLRARCCFSVLGSRRSDRRVTAWWLSGGRPRLGWCFAGAPHTWLGSASAASRLA